MKLEGKTIFDFTNDPKIISNVKSRTGVNDLDEQWYKSADTIVRLNHIAIFAIITNNKNLLNDVEHDVKEYEDYVSERADFGEIID